MKHISASLSYCAFEIIFVTLFLRSLIIFIVVVKWGLLLIVNGEIYKWLIVSM